MDIELSTDDLAFRREVQDFLKSNGYRPPADYPAWRDDWFKKAAAKGGWDVPKWWYRLPILQPASRHRSSMVVASTPLPMKRPRAAFRIAARRAGVVVRIVNLRPMAES